MPPSNLVVYSESDDGNMETRPNTLPKTNGPREKDCVRWRDGGFLQSRPPLRRALIYRNPREVFAAVVARRV